MANHIDLMTEAQLREAMHRIEAIVDAITNPVTPEATRQQLGDAICDIAEIVHPGRVHRRGTL